MVSRKIAAEVREKPGEIREFEEEYVYLDTSGGSSMRRAINERFRLKELLEARSLTDQELEQMWCAALGDLVNITQEEMEENWRAAQSCPVERASPMERDRWMVEEPFSHDEQQEPVKINLADVDIREIKQAVEPIPFFRRELQIHSVE